MNILGISPDYRVRVSEAVLAGYDGPMLQRKKNGLKQMEGGQLIVPGSEELRPNREFLAERFGRFRAA